MSKPQSLRAKLVPVQNPSPPSRRSAPAVIDFGQKLVRHPDIVAAATMVETQTALEFGAQDGALLERTKHELDELDARHKASAATLEELEKQKAGTDPYVKTCVMNSGMEDEKIRWRDWRTKDQVMLGVTVIFLILAMVMGAGNVYANLMSSGNPVFLDDPWLALMLSTLLPIGSAAIKFVTNPMTVDSTRKRYVLCIYSLTVLSLAAWSVLFAMNFTGVSGGIDWDSLGESNDSGAALVWAQLIVEMLAASALFLAAEEIWIKYSPDWYTDNLKYLSLEKSLKNHLIAHEKLCQQRAEKHGLYIELINKRDAYINNKVADYINLRGRFDAVNNADF